MRERGVFNVFSLHKVLWVIKVFRVVKGSLRTLIFSHLLKEVSNQNKKRQSWELRLINSLIQQVAAETSIPFFLFSLQSFSWLMRLFSLWWCVRRSEVVLHLFFILSLLLIRWALGFEEPENNQAPEQDDGGFGPARPLVVSGSQAPQTWLVHPPRLPLSPLSRKFWRSQYLLWTDRK